MMGMSFSSKGERLFIQAIRRYSRPVKLPYRPLTQTDDRHVGNRPFALNNFRQIHYNTTNPRRAPARTASVRLVTPSLA
jgi:hypothetical protein